MRAKKSLGQNFLTSRATAEDIVRAAKVSDNDTVIEVGPGKGILTETLLKSAGRVIAVEKDDRLIPYLREKFKGAISEKRLVISRDDILNFQPATCNLQHRSYKIVANIPYYITGQLLRLFLEHKIKPTSITLLVQKEVGQRIVARDGKESILSISVKLFGQPRYIRKVSASLFSPKPKVDSAILTIENIKEPFETIKERDYFFKILKTGFAHKRKMLSGNLKTLFDEKTVVTAFQTCNIGEKERAENLTLSDWKCLVLNL